MSKPLKSLKELQSEFAISDSVASRVSGEVYQTILKAIFADREIDQQEEERLYQIREYLNIDPKMMKNIENSELSDLYSHFIDYFYTDQLVEKSEVYQLALIKENLERIFPESIVKINHQKRVKILNSSLEKIKEDGVITDEELAEIEQLMKVLNIPSQIKEWMMLDINKFRKAQPKQ